MKLLGGEALSAAFETNLEAHVVAYIRMSSDRQRWSTERQRFLVEAYAKQKGYVIGEFYCDLSVPGEGQSRPEFLRLLADARSGKIALVLIDEPSRLSRTRPSKFIAESIYPLAQAGVKVEAVSSGDLSWENVAELIKVVIHAAHSTTEVKNLSRRTLEGMAKLVRAGWWHGDVPLGYVLTEERDTSGSGRIISRHLAPGDCSLVKAVKWAFKEYAAGRCSYSQIALRLASQGIVSKERRGELLGRPITPRGIRLMLRNRAYVGDTLWNKHSNGKYAKLVSGKAEFHPNPGKNAKHEWIEVLNTHPPLVSKTTFQTVQHRLLSLPKRKSARPKSEYAFSTLLICGDCGSRMSGRTREGKRGVAKTYGCRTYKEYGPSQCHSNVVRESTLLSLIASSVRTELTSVSSTMPGLPRQPLIAEFWRLLTVLEQGTTVQVREAFGALFDKVILRFKQHHHKKLIDSILVIGEMYLRQTLRSNATTQLPRLTFHA